VAHIAPDQGIEGVSFAPPFALAAGCAARHLFSQPQPALDLFRICLGPAHPAILAAPPIMSAPSLIAPGDGITAQARSSTDFCNSMASLQWREVMLPAWWRPRDAARIRAHAVTALFHVSPHLVTRQSLS